MKNTMRIAKYKSYTFLRITAESQTKNCAAVTSSVGFRLKEQKENPLKYIDTFIMIV
jgi:hypothetical protein